MSRTRDGIDRRIRALLEAGAVGDLGDGRLLERFASGEGEAAEAAFAALVERHGTLVWRVCRSILADPNDADDAFQATFLVLVRRSRTLWVRDSLGPWLLRVARRTALRARDRARRRRLREQAAAGSRPISAEPRPLDDLAAIHEEIARLPERYRSVVVLCLLQGLRDEQAAARLGWPVGTVHSRLARGRERLRASLTRRGLAPSAALIAASRLPAEAASSAVPPHLVEATARAASLLVADGLRSAAVPIAVASLVEGAARMSWIANVKSALAAALLGGAAIATALGSPGHGPAEGGPPAPAESSAKPADRATVPPDPPAASGPTSAVELRFSFPTESDIGLASGTIIHSTADESIIITSARPLVQTRRADPNEQVEASAIRVVVHPEGSAVVVHPEGSAEAAGEDEQVEVPPEDFEAERLAADFGRDLALIRFRPGRVMPSSTVVPRTAKLKQGDRLVTNALPPRRRETSLLDPDYRSPGEDRRDFRGLVCESSEFVDLGAGLVLPGTGTARGSLVGVSSTKSPSSVKVYAGPEAIYHILAANGLTALIPEDELSEPRSSASIPGPKSHPSWSTVDIQVDARRWDTPPVETRGWNLGTIISSTSNDSLILTSARLLDPGNGPRKIVVRYPDPTTPGDIPRPDRYDTVEGELMARDADLDLAAIRIRPGRLLPAIRLAQADRVPASGEELLRTVHLGDGATALRYTQATNAEEFSPLSGQPRYRGTWCLGLPLPREVGGPLVRRLDSQDFWEIVGVCNGAIPDRNVGRYASPAAIRRFLEVLQIGKLEIPSLGDLSPAPGDEKVGRKPAAPSPAPSEPSPTTNTSLRPAADNPPAATSPSTDPPTNPEPLRGESATPLVRIAAGGSGGAKGFGVVIRSGAGGSLALTACRLVVPDGLETPPEDIRVTVSAGPNEVYAEPAPAGATFSARVVARDAARNLALLAFDAGRVLPTSQIAPREWNPNDAVRELTVYKLDDGGHLAARRRKIVDPDVRGRMGEVEYSAIECEGAPKLDELGMPLDYGLPTEGRPRFVTVGICNYSDAPTQTRTADAPPKPTTGLFASPEMIHQFLEAQDLAGPVPATPAEARRPAPARPFERLPKPKAKPASGGVAEPAIPISEAPKPRTPDATQIVGERLAAERERLDRLDAQVGEIGRKLDRLLDALKAPASGR